jgi:hypothetical protein
MRKLVYHLEVVLVNVDGFYRTHFMAFPTVDAAMLLYGCRSFADSYSFGWAGFEATHAANAFLIVYFYCVYEHLYFVFVGYVEEWNGLWGNTESGW